MTETEQEAEANFALEFYVRRNIRYHLRRYAFFTKWSRFIAFVGVLFGSAAAATLIAGWPKWATAGLALVVTVAAAIDLIVGISQRGALHNDLRRDYLSIQEDIACKGEPSADDRKAYWAKIHRIESDEPPEKTVLELMSRNEVVCSLYDDEERSTHFVAIPWHMKITAHWINWDVTELRPSRPVNN